MGATIQPAFERQPVPFTRVSCGACKQSTVWPFEERHRAYQQDSCLCGEDLPWPDFYPTEFQWEEASWTYGSVQTVITQLGGKFDDCGRISTQQVMSNLHRVTDPARRETIRRIAELASRLQVDIIWC